MAMRNKKAFSLVEVVVAVGIFALSIVGVIGLLSPTNKAVADVSDSDAASRAISAIQSGLQRSGFATVAARLDGTYAFCASKSGDKVGLRNDTTVFPDPSEKFFEFALIRNETLSPSGNDNTAGFLAFTISLRWPAFLANGTELGGGLTGAAKDAVDAQKSVLIIPAAITR